MPPRRRSARLNTDPATETPLLQPWTRPPSRQLSPSKLHLLWQTTLPPTTTTGEVRRLPIPTITATPITLGPTPGGVLTRSSWVCKPKTFHGDSGMVALTRWFEKMESVFDICACPEELKEKYAACTFADAAYRGGTLKLKP